MRGACCLMFALSLIQDKAANKRETIRHKPSALWHVFSCGENAIWRFYTEHVNQWYFSLYTGEEYTPISVFLLWDTSQQALNVKQNKWFIVTVKTFFTPYAVVRKTILCGSKQCLWCIVWTFSLFLDLLRFAGPWSVLIGHLYWT